MAGTRLTGGAFVGASVGSVGLLVGLTLGTSVGALVVGSPVGYFVPPGSGNPVGYFVFPGRGAVGYLVGASVGNGVVVFVGYAVFDGNLVAFKW